MIRNPRRLLLLCSMAATGLATPISAQEVEQAEDDEIAEEAEEDDEVIIVQGTRLGRRVRDEAIRVEVIAGEEIEEKAIMRPGNIAMLVNETGGVRVQVTSPPWARRTSAYRGSRAIHSAARG